MCFSCTRGVQEKLDLCGNDVIVCKIDDAAGKTSLSSNTPVWTNGDAITVISAENGGKGAFSLISGAGTAQGTFQGPLPSATNFVAIYPHSDANSLSSGKLTFKKAQTSSSSAGTFAQGDNVMVASFSNSSLTPSFQNVFGLLEIRLKGTATVGKLTVTTNKSGEMLWGDCALTINGYQGSDNQTLALSSGGSSTSITFASPVALNSSSSKSFFFDLPAGTLSSGFSLDVYDASGNLVYTKTTGSNKTISRSTIRRMPELDGVDKLPVTNIVPEPTKWSAYNNLKRSGTADATVIDPQTSGYPSAVSRGKKYVGMFYFILHGHHDSDKGGPYNIQENLGEGNYEYSTSTGYYGPPGMAHHWGKPYLDYYIAGEEWVIRKHAQLLSDAGVDFISLDITNGYTYDDTVLEMCRVFKAIRDEGNDTPQIVFMTANKNDAEGVKFVYNFYTSHKEYSDLWFIWDGKPLMLADKSLITNSTHKNYFTFRQSWYLWNSSWQTAADKGDSWWGDGVDKWPWGCCYTADNDTDGMKAGTHNGINECACVMPGTHPISNLGRSFPVGSGKQSKSGSAGSSYTKDPAKGTYFKSQFAATMKLDPQVMFFTGWNEWVADRLSSGTLNFKYMGGKTEKNNTVFVDQYNHEFSRDIEPLDGNFGDNYYYYMVDFIRKFKGVDSTPSYSSYTTIDIDGKFADWIKVESCYADDKGDVFNRTNVKGWNSKSLSNNTTGRNDLRVSKIATDGTNLYFYIDAASSLSGYSAGASTGLNLYLKTGSGSNWEGFTYKLLPTSASAASLYKCDGGWSWTEVSGSGVQCRVSGNAMEVSIPLASIGIGSSTSFSVDFKWVDNVDLSQTGGIQRCMRDGDSAPNGRFSYRYVFSR